MPRRFLVTLAACGAPSVTPDAAPPAPPTITATVASTRFVTREHMLAAGEMQISGEPFAEAMGRNLGDYSRDHVPPNIYFDDSPTSAGPWIDLAGYSTGVESYEYSKQPMNFLAFESGGGTALYHAVPDLAGTIHHFALGSNAYGKWVFDARTKLALGWTHQTADIGGFTLTSNPTNGTSLLLTPADPAAFYRILGQ